MKPWREETLPWSACYKRQIQMLYPCSAWLDHQSERSVEDVCAGGSKHRADDAAFAAPYAKRADEESVHKA